MFDTDYCATSNDCCTVTDGMSNFPGWIPAVAFALPFVLMKLMKRCSKFETSEEGDPNNAAIADPENGETYNADAMKNMFAGMTKTQKYLTLALFLAAIGATIAEGIIMPKQIQQKLTPTDRVAQMVISHPNPHPCLVFECLEGVVRTDIIVLKAGSVYLTGYRTLTSFLALPPGNV